MGTIEATETAIALDSHETDRIGLLIRNFYEANRSFEVRVHFIIGTNAEKKRGVFILSDDSFEPTFFEG